MVWMSLSLLSAVLLGFYDIAKKVAARDNAVPVVLLISTSIGAAIWIPLLLWQQWWPAGEFPIAFLRVEPLTLWEHGYLLAKAVLVGTSWTLALFALKHLPLSIAAPVRSTSPLWTLAIAVLFLGERPTGLQWIGVLIVLISFWAFSVVGRREGIRFAGDRWVALMVAATLLGAVSSIYDKILLQQLGFGPATVQAWFAIYLVPVMMPLAIRWWWRSGGRTSVTQSRGGHVVPSDPPVKETSPSVTEPSPPVTEASSPLMAASPPVTEGSEAAGEVRFEFRPAVLWISPLLLAADMVYFTALANPEALVSVVSTLRRCSVVVALVVGGRRLGEANLKKKSVCVAGILGGVVLILVA